VRNVVNMAVAAVLIVLAVVAGKIIGKIREPKKSEIPPAEDILSKAVAEANKELPMMIDAATRLDRASTNGNVLRYHYTLLQRPAPGETLEQLQAGVPALAEAARKKVCADGSLRPLLGIGIAMTYTYVTTTGAQAFEFTVWPQDCFR